MIKRANELLKQAYGASTTFRTGQLEAIEALVLRQERLLVVQPTGWGKSLVYFVATKLLREQGRGPTLLISPLLALMRNQQEAAQKLGLVTRSITSENKADWDAVIADLASDEVDVLLISPERLGTEQFNTTIRPALIKDVGLLVVDEAHCISDWGHDFRPDYRRIVRVVQRLPKGTPVLGTTATATDRVIKDVEAQLGPNLIVQRGPLTRRSLRLQNVALANPAERLAWLAQVIPTLRGTGIIYCLTKADAQRVAAYLESRGIAAASYYNGLDSETCQERERLLQENKIKVLVATVKLGMGYDKPDLRFVIHYQRPSSVVAYYQQVGRAGRDGEDALGILLSGAEDDEIAEYFIEQAFPTEELTLKVLRLIERPAGASEAEMLQQINERSGRVAQVLKLLEINQVIYKEMNRYFRSPAVTYTSDRPTQDQVTGRRRYEMRRMQEYQATDGCLMEFLARELDDPEAGPCGRCASCTGAFVPAKPQARLVTEALDYLKRLDYPLDPRKQWPDRKRIPFDRRVEVGRALCLWGDPGWGELVKRGKYPVGGAQAVFDDALVAASVTLVQERWKPNPMPTWVTCVPSRNRPDLVASFARRLAAGLELPFRPALQKVRDTAPQKDMENPAKQLANIQDAFAVEGEVPSGPVLLVDDVVDSRWTLTVCGMRLLEAGSGPVYPFALAVATKGSDDQ